MEFYYPYLLIFINKYIFLQQIFFHQHIFKVMPPKKVAKNNKAKAKEQQKKKVSKTPVKKAVDSKSKSKAKSQPKSASKPKKLPQPKKIVPKAPQPKAKSLPKSKAGPNSKAKSPPKAQKQSKDTKNKKAPSPDKKDNDVKGKRDASANKKADDDKKQPVKKTKSIQNIVKVVTKGGAAVDSLVQNSGDYRVYANGGKVYSCTLNQSNLGANNNKFYIIQVLVNQKTGAYSVWNRWGRVGVPGQNVMKPMPSKQTAISDYQSKRRDKTVSGNYTQIQIKYDDQPVKKVEQKPKSGKPKKQVKSSMDQGIQNLMNLIFDTKVMDNTMKQIGYDAKKMPLGRLGDSTIKQAYSVLSDLSQALKQGNRAKLSQDSGRFYSLIPHDFGFQKMSNFILDNEQKIKQKLNMLQAISDMKITTKLLDQKTDDELSVLDQNYKKLGCDIKTVDEKSNQYSLLKEYFDNTKGDCYSKVKVGEIYEVFRPHEQKSYNSKIGNDMLLWHGSRVSNFVGILSQGLRIAPPEAPVSGYLFGKGIYLADMAQKSINYCRSHGSDTALILLIEGAIGNPNVLLQSNHQAKQLAQKAKKDSTKCHGAKAPPQQTYVKHKNMIVPKGKAQPTKSGSYMGHNQYIVYNMNQARIRYLIRMDMKGQ